MKVFLKRTPHDPVPDDRFVYIVGKNGCFMKKTSLVGTAVVPVREVTVLAPVECEAHYTLPPFPAQLVADMYGFFKRVYDVHHSEALLLIAYNPETRTFMCEAPHQLVSSGGCRHIMPTRSEVKGFTFIGTIHSHGDMGAFHSSVDVDDEAGFDGVHLTMGYLHKSVFELVASLSVSGIRFPLSVLGVCQGLCEADPWKEIEPQVQKQFAYLDELLHQRDYEEHAMRSHIPKSAPSSPAQNTMRVQFVEPAPVPAPNPSWFTKVFLNETTGVVTTFSGEVLDIPSRPPSTHTRRTRGAS